MQNDIIIVDDNASFTSSCDSSVIKYQGGLRRRRTVQRLSRWASKKISRRYLAVDNSSNREVEQEDHDLYESYAAFCHAFTTSGQHQQTEAQSHSLPRDGDGDCADSPARPTLRVDVHNHKNNNHNDTTRLSSPGSSPPSLSDSQSTTHRDSSSRENDLDLAFGAQHLQRPVPPLPPEPQSLLRSVSIESKSLPPLPVSPPATLASVSSSQPPPSSSQKYEDAIETMPPTFDMPFTPPSRLPVPPPRILTPSLYAQRRAASRERKRLQRCRLWEPIRSWFAETRGRQRDVR